MKSDSPKHLTTRNVKRRTLAQEEWNLISNNDNEYSKLHILGWAQSAIELEALKSDDSRHCFAQTAALLFEMYCIEVQSKHTETWKENYCFFVLIG